LLPKDHRCVNNVRKIRTVSGMGKVPSYSDVIGSIYDAALDSALWDNVTALVADYCDGEKIMLATTDTLHPDSNLQFTHNIPEEKIALWRQGLDEEEVEMHRQWGASVPPGTPISSDDYFGGPEQFRAQGGAFVEMLNSLNIRRQMVMFFEIDHFRLSGLGLNNDAPFASYAAERMGALAIHLRRAFEIHHQFAKIEKEKQSLYQLLELMDVGVMLLDAKHRLRYTTQKARQMIILNNGFAVRQGVLTVKEVSCQRKLRLLLTGASQIAQREPSISAGGVLGVKAANGYNLSLSVVPLSQLADYRELESDRITTAVFVSHQHSEVSLPLGALADLYGLTPREQQLCQAFVNHVELDEVAIQLNLKRSSVRSLLKSIYSKTEQNSQAGLMRLLMSARLNFRHIKNDTHEKSLP